MAIHSERLGRCRWRCRGRLWMRHAAIYCAIAATAGVCVAAPSSRDSISSTPFGVTPSGAAVELYTLRNGQGMEARIATYGGIVTYLAAPDRAGRYADVVLGYDTLAGYLKDSPYFGALIGRYGNRIAHGKFALDGVTHTLATNNGPNSLHGGKVGFDKVVWHVAKAQVTEWGPQLTLTYSSRDGEEGYPGTLSVTAVYTLSDDNALRLEYNATTDKDTVVNLTQHSYFNLRGRDDILQHKVQINADRFTPVDSTLIPTGELRSVEGNRPQSAPVSMRRMSSCDSARATTTTGSLISARECWVSMPSCTNPKAVAFWRSLLTSQACSSTAGISSMAPSRASAGGFIDSAMGFAWSHNTSRIHLTSGSSPRRC